MNNPFCPDKIRADQDQAREAARRAGRAPAELAWAVLSPSICAWVGATIPLLWWKPVMGWFLHNPWTGWIVWGLMSWALVFNVSRYALLTRETE